MNSLIVRILLISTFLVAYCFNENVDGKVALAGANKYKVKTEAPIEIHQSNDDSDPHTWTLSDIQNKLSEQIKEFNNFKQNPVPINFIYTQLPNQPDPKSLWPTVEWKDVTSQYSGHFFRAEGTNSATFGTVQEDNAPRIKEVQFCDSGYHNCTPDYYNSFGYNTFEPDSWSPYVLTGSQRTSNAYSYFYTSFYTSPGEVRPRNMAIRIWKRTA